VKSKFLSVVATLIVILAIIAYIQPANALPIYAADNETSITVVTSATFDSGFLILMALVFGGIATLGFVIAELIGMYVTKSAQTSIVQTTTTGINAIVSMTTLGATASQAATVTEIGGVPTQIVTSEKSKV
jgi:hypothetical protein